MKTPQVPAMPGMTPLGSTPKEWQPIEQELVRLHDLAKDQRTVAERKWQARKLAPAPQKPCDHGLFSDDAKQLDLMEKCK